MEIVERHNHSVDIYKESDRYAPLGSDATVVYGYKDLRVRNNFPFPVKFEIELKGPNMVCSLNSAEKLFEKKIEFRRNYFQNGVSVSTIINGIEKEISSYKLRFPPSVNRQRSGCPLSTVSYPSN